jgi:hypothetical protein
MEETTADHQHVQPLAHAAAAADDADLANVVAAAAAAAVLAWPASRHC